MRGVCTFWPQPVHFFLKIEFCSWILQGQSRLLAEGKPLLFVSAVKCGVIQWVNTKTNGGTSVAGPPYLPICFTYAPLQGSLRETQMWKRSSCLVLSGVIKKRFGHTESPQETWDSAEVSSRLREHQDPAAGFLGLVTVRDCKYISLIAAASLRPSVCVGGRARAAGACLSQCVLLLCLSLSRQSHCKDRAETKFEN